jgi:hypothetical protein
LSEAFVAKAGSFSDFPNLMAKNNWRGWLAGPGRARSMRKQQTSAGLNIGHRRLRRHEFNGLKKNRRRNDRTTKHGLRASVAGGQIHTTPLSNR